MAETLFFVRAEQQDPNQISADYELRGWDIVATAPTAPDSLTCMAEAGPVAAVFCLDAGSGSDVMALAEQVMADERTNRPLMVFVDGAPEEIALAKQIAPYGIFVRPDELAWVLKRLVLKS